MDGSLALCHARNSEKQFLNWIKVNLDHLYPVIWQKQGKILFEERSS